jgi:oligoendopeptidase F
MRPALLFCAALLASFAAAAADWKEDSITLGYQIDAFDKCRGRLAERPRFSGCVKMWDDAYRRANRMDAQAAESLAKEPANADAQALVERSAAFGRRLDAATEFIQPEIRKLGPAKVHQFVASEKLLAKYRAPLDAVLAAPPAAPLDPRALWKN